MIIEMASITVSK